MKILALISRSLIYTRDEVIAVSWDREKLIDCARLEWLHLDTARLRLRGNAFIDDAHQATIEETEYLT